MASDPPKTQYGKAAWATIYLVNLILVDATACGTSEVHIGRDRSAARVSYRLKGRLTNAGQFPASLFDRVVNRLRVMSKLSLADPRRMQKGSFRILARGLDPLTREGFQVGFAFEVVIPASGDSHAVVLYRTASEGKVPEGAFADVGETVLFKKAGSFRLRLAFSGSGREGRPTRG